MTDIQASSRDSLMNTLAKSIRRFGMTRLIIFGFFILLMVVAGFTNLNVTSLMSNVLLRAGYNSILVLAMLPGIQCGIGLNMGMTLGIIGGLLSTVICLQFNMAGWGALFFASAVGAVFGMIIGYLYGLLLNRLKGQEMTVSTYLGFSFVALMCVFWMALPFDNPRLTWPLGPGLRTMHNMDSSFGKLLNNFLSFKVFGVVFPTGLYLFLGLCCYLLWLFLRTKTGVAMSAAGSNPRFAEATGININKMRIIGTILSTVIAALGIIIYSQGFGFMQLYNAPKQMGFIAASSILIGGASVSRAKISHVVLGSILFNGVLAVGMPVANALVTEGNISDVLRVLLSNGIILYALTKSGGDTRE